jgi:hypothetical protein
MEINELRNKEIIIEALQNKLNFETEGKLILQQEIEIFKDKIDEKDKENSEFQSQIDGILKTELETQICFKEFNEKLQEYEIENFNLKIQLLDETNY